jgi:predicted nucleic acid-binding protein
MAIAYLLDTSVLLHWTRGKDQAKVIEQQFDLVASRLRPLVCEVSIGEMLAFSRNPQWSEKQRQRMEAIHEHVTVIDISDRRVLEAYADLSTLAQASRWPLFSGKNDLWVAAAANVAQAHLITMDKDFMPLRGLEGWAVTILDSRTALPLP